jgi:hypothetical protein
MKILRFIKRHAFGLVLALATAAAVTGCATQEPDNASARPWNAPKSWEGQLPMGINEGR